MDEFLELERNLGRQTSVLASLASILLIATCFMAITGDSRSILGVAMFYTVLIYPIITAIRKQRRLNRLSMLEF